MSKKKSLQPDEPAANASPAPQAAAAKRPYLVLARKYRPTTFDSLIGQETMVRTLKNAFSLGRIAQAYMLTGVRGVGKTTTARILARALNYSRPGVADGPTIDMPEFGEHCQAILESRHMDVVEMDAASNTGIDDIREIIESAKYMPAYARYKVFIIDEVHMLSKAAFNGLLKTLEEPPPHVKFIFATTEIRKVPVTVLSRCQRFDLRRVDIAVLKEHFARIAKAEGQSIEDDALTIIARLAEGSVRDGLSLLDQAFALCGGHVTAADVQAMTGLADGVRIYELLDAIFKGDAAAALAGLAALYDAGAEPVQALTDLADAVHNISRIKAAGPEAAGAGLSQAEREHAASLAARLSVPALSRAWQMLIKGLDEAARAPRAAAAAEMVLIRLCYAADLPPPGELIKSLTGSVAGGASGNGGKTNQESVANESRARTAPFASEAPQGSSDGAPELDDSMADASFAEAPPPAPPVALTSFRDIVALASAKRDIKLKIALEDDVSLVRFKNKDRQIELNLLPSAPANLVQDLARKLQDWTGERWIISVSDAPGERPLGEARREDEARMKEEALRHPVVRAVLRHFPEAEIVSVKPLGNEGDAKKKQK